MVRGWRTEQGRGKRARSGGLEWWKREDILVEKSAREYLGGSSERRESLEAWRAMLIFMRTKRKKEQVIVPKMGTGRYGKG